MLAGAGVTEAPPASVTVTLLAKPVRAGGRTHKKWKVAFHPAGADPTAGEIMSAHTTEAAAQGAGRRYLADWAPRQQGMERARWAYSVVADPEGQLGNGFDRAEAKARAGRLVVRLMGNEQEVLYRRRPHPRRPGRIEVLREDRMLSESLAIRWHGDPEGYAPSRFGDEADLRHPYAPDLLQDACGLAGLATRDAPRQRGGLWEAIPAFAAEVLDGLGETYEITAAEILRWLERHGVISLVETAQRG